jgi:PTH1 family peptidyl-tRNA hydrolase
VKRLVVGLGNPGADYVWTPHNLGFHVVERLCADAHLIFEPSAVLGLPALSAPCRVARHTRCDALLVEPLTYMNGSGLVVATLSRALGVPSEEILVVYDDLDLPLGALRIRPHGGTGGHRGVQSIVEELGTDRFPRLRVGIGRPRTDAARHVLTPMAPDERVIAEIAVSNAAEAIASWLSEGSIERCMTRFHSRWKQGPEQADTTP